MTGASLALWLLARDGTLTRVDGTILCLGGVAYTAGVIWTSRQESAAVQADYAAHSEQSRSRGRRELLLRALTSGDRDLAVGNLLGSTVYNVAFILGVTVLVAPAEIQIPHEVIAADLLILALVALLTVPVLLSGHRISRLEGGAFVATYLGYLAWLILV
jgi:cation:H+ antiporter